MYERKPLNQFKRDLRAFSKRKEFDLDLLEYVINVLAIPEKLPPKYRDHGLQGNYKGFRECHILPDWLLIYRYTDTLELVRTGTHSELFKK